MKKWILFIILVFILGCKENVKKRSTLTPEKATEYFRKIEDIVQ